MPYPITPCCDRDSEIDRLQWEVDLLRAELEHAVKKTHWLEEALANVIRDSHK